MNHVSIFRHALALDERRVKFLPEYVNEGVFKSDTVPESSNSAVRTATDPGEKKSKRDTTAGQAAATEGSSRPMPTEGMSAGHVPLQIPDRH